MQEVVELTCFYCGIKFPGVEDSHKLTDAQAEQLGFIVDRSNPHWHGRNRIRCNNEDCQETRIPVPIRKYRRKPIRLGS